MFDHWLVDGVTHTEHPLQVEMDEAKEVTAVFAELLIPLHVVVDPSNQGWVESNPPGIECGGELTSCTAYFTPNETVYLQAYNRLNYAFHYWSEGEESQPVYYVTLHGVTMDVEKTVSAFFSPSPGISVDMNYGKGLVSEYNTAIPRINCPMDCEENIGYQQTITLKAIPSDRFDHWLENGVDVGSENPRNFSITGGNNVAAVFNVIPFNEFISFARVGDILLFSNCEEGQEPLTCADIWGVEYGHYGHAALVYEVNQETLTLLHAPKPLENTELKIYDLQKAQKFGDAALFRVNNVSEEDAAEAIEFAYETWNGTAYDSFLSLESSDVVFCSEICLRAYLHLGVDLRDGVIEGIYVPDYIAKSSKVNLVSTWWKEE